MLLSLHRWGYRQPSGARRCGGCAAADAVVPPPRRSTRTRTRTAEGVSIKERRRHKVVRSYASSRGPSRTPVAGWTSWCPRHTDPGRLERAPPLTPPQDPTTSPQGSASAPPANRNHRVQELPECCINTFRYGTYGSLIVERCDGEADIEDFTFQGSQIMAPWEEIIDVRGSRRRVRRGGRARERQLQPSDCVLDASSRMPFCT